MVISCSMRNEAIVIVRAMRCNAIQMIPELRNKAIMRYNLQITILSSASLDLAWLDLIAKERINVEDHS